jgi:L-lysine 2,3-aminomutase
MLIGGLSADPVGQAQRRRRDVPLSVSRTCHVKCTYCFRGDLVTNTKARLLVTPWNGNERFLDEFLQNRRDAFARAVSAATLPSRP